MKISVGICTHNGEKFIAEQLTSIITQSVKPDEIILSDDASQDKTVEIAEKILKDSGIYHEIIAYDTHQGILKNFSQCLDKCTGDVIFSCDQDDVWMYNKIEKFIPYFERGCNFVYSNACVVDTNRNLLQKDFWSCYGVDFEKLSIDEFRMLLLKNCCIAGCNMAFTKELYDRIRPIPYHFLHDGWIAICASWFGEIGFINEPLIEYRRHGDNVSAFQEKSKDNSIKGNKLRKKSEEIWSCYRKATPEEWFGNQHFFVANEIFYTRMNEYISQEYAETVIRCVEFYGLLLHCLPRHRVKSIAILIRQYIKGNYQLFRGNKKRLIMDIVYMCVNENTKFKHDIKKW